MTMHEQLRILVVDDEPDVAEVVAGHLRFHDLAVEVCNEGKSVLAKVRDEGFHLVLLDLVMPEMTGWEVLEALRANETTHHVPVIILSALVDTNDIVRGLEAGANDYVLKPADYDELAARIRRHVTLHRGLAELRDRTAPHGAGGDGTTARRDELAAFLAKLEEPLQHLCLSVSMAQLNSPGELKACLEPVARIVRELQELVMEAAPPGA